jgi:transcriptional regulator with XRE-family HTH domain
MTHSRSLLTESVLFSLPMIHERVRQARIERNLSQVQLAEMAGVPRERVRTLERGGNVTLSTFEKIVAQLPNLKELIIGGVRVTISGIDVEDVRAAIAEADLASRKLLSLLDTIRAHAPEPPAGATLVEPSTRLRPELELRLAELESKVQAIQGGRQTES